MSIFQKLFGSQSNDENTLAALEQLERVADSGSAIEGMEMMTSMTGRGFSATLGPRGPLHDRFIAAITKIRAKVSDKVMGKFPISDAEMARLSELMSRMQK